jgi:hypothetical protein
MLIGDALESYEPTAEELIEEARLALPSSGLTPVTRESYDRWLADRRARWEEEIHAKVRAAEAAGARGASRYSGLSGREIFTADAAVFVDDDGAVDDDAYAERNDGGVAGPEEAEGVQGEEGYVVDAETEALVAAAAAAAATATAAAGAGAAAAGAGAAAAVDEGLFLGGDDDEEDEEEDEEEEEEEGEDEAGAGEGAA